MERSFPSYLWDWLTYSSQAVEIKSKALLTTLAFCWRKTNPGHYCGYKATLEFQARTVIDNADVAIAVPTLGRRRRCMRRKAGGVVRIIMYAYNLSLQA